ncbi:MAG: hypothetical protein ABSH25_10425 [Syntrophorhabdales bacterium]
MVRQLWDVLTNGYWHARGPEFLNQRTSTMFEWLRVNADLMFIVFGVVPLLLAVGKTYWLSNRGAGKLLLP